MEVTEQERAPFNSALLVLGPDEHPRTFEQRPGSVYLRDDPKFPKLCELPSETLMRVDAIRKACLADLDCA